MGKFNSDIKVFFMIFIGVILAIALLTPAADTIFTSTNTFNNTNETVTAPAINETLTLTGRSLTGATPVVRNSTGISLQNEGVFVTDGLINGVQTVFLQVNDSGVPNNGTSVNVTYFFVPDGFVPGAGGLLLSLVIIFGTLAILVFVVTIVMKEGSMRNFIEGFGKK
ncbi:hypothetical protein LCGC14_0477420 [marine sediment metagenome]|uniref:Uncharacterized protein n=1 Tax=marine sediment metagenome TaxID=412755 RepID=A0A0F9UXA9_9ZZZZ